MEACQAVPSIADFVTDSPATVCTPGRNDPDCDLIAEAHQHKVCLDGGYDSGDLYITLPQVHVIHGVSLSVAAGQTPTISATVYPFHSDITYPHTMVTVS